MSVRFCAAALAAAWLAGASGAPAADLYGPEGPYGRGSPYDDPRYSDIYKDPAPRYATPYQPREYLPPYAPRFREPARYPDYSYYGNGCVPRYEVKERLLRQGWHAFTDLELRGEVAFVRARRANGRLYELQVDRCSGSVIEARAAGYPGAYAWGPRNGYRWY